MKVIPNDGGFRKSNIKDTNNCSVIALAIAYNIHYKIADEIATNAGRKRNKGFHIHKLMEYIKKETNLKSKKVRLKNKITIRRFLEQNPIGRFIVVRNDHAFAVICGEIHDMVEENTERQMVYEAYETFSLEM
jgi:hypothetical protein